MSKDTKIGWADDSVNLWHGCVEVSPGCDNCYAREMSNRYGHEVWGVHAPRRIIKSAFDTLDRLQRLAEKTGRRRVFVNSMSDLAEVLPEKHPQRAEIDGLRQAFFDLIENGYLDDLDLIWLTKRIGNVPKLVPHDWMEGNWPENLWLVPSIVNQAEKERDLYKLQCIPTRVKGLSCEPLLGPIRNLFDYYMPQHNPLRHPLYGPFRASLDWVIVGGESGPKRRPMELEWLTSIVDQCQAAGVACFVKQDSALRDGQQGRIPDDHWQVKEFPHA